MIQRKVSDMSKQMLADPRAFIFLGLLSFVVGDEGVLANNFEYESLPLISTLKVKCLESLDPFFCNYWEDPLGYKVTASDTSNSFKTKQNNDLTSENRTTENDIPDGNSQEEISPELPFLSPENQLNKRFTTFRRRNPIARGYKRGPGFRSWGGKRDPMLSGENFDEKSKFVSYSGGKEDGELSPDDSINFSLEVKDAPDKRPKFQNWGGKKSTNDFFKEFGGEIEKKPIWKERFYLSEPFKKHVPKRPQFQSWGGKRSQYPWHELFESLHSQPKFILNGGEKRKFSSWGGKRYDHYENQNVHWIKNFKKYFIQNWGGKRTTSDVDSSQGVRDMFKTKESNPSEKVKQKDKSRGNAVWEDVQSLSDLDPTRDGQREGKGRR